jgi:quercetin dioxygenase-like cupin family protein
MRRAACEVAVRPASASEKEIKMTNAAPDVKSGNDWPEAIKSELLSNSRNGCVGQIIVSETDRVRVWSLRLQPGQRIGFHRHVLDYFWTALTDGRARSHKGDGTIHEAIYRSGDTQHMNFGKDEFMVHDLHNIGDTDLVFTTVEFLNSANAPLPVPNSVYRQP